MLPMRGYPFGPGGYGGRLLFRRHFKSKTKDAAAQSEAAYRVLLLLISRGEPARRGCYRFRRPDPSFIGG
jgi:hypothetical protein